MRDLVRGNVIVGSTQTKLWPAGSNLVGFNQLRLVFHCFDHRGSALVAELAFWWILKVSWFWLDQVELSGAGSRNALSFLMRPVLVLVVLVRPVMVLVLMVLARPVMAPLVTGIRSARPSGLARMHRGSLFWPRVTNCWEV